MTKKFSAMILAAGFGKRMESLTENKPKPLIKVGKEVLLKKIIDTLLKIGCEKIVINTHYKHELILNFLKVNYAKFNIIVSYEKNILDTGGGVKYASKLFTEDSILVMNSDIYLYKRNEEDLINLIKNYNYNDLCRLLLIEKNKAHGIINKKGDFTIKKNLLERWEPGDDIIYYSGIQIVNLGILKKIKLKKFSFNYIWDSLIKKNSLHGTLMSSELYHVGDKKGLKTALKSIT